MKKIIINLLLIFISTQTFATETFYVKTAEDGGNDVNDGRSWATAFADVQKAIDAAASVATDDSLAQVWIAKGTYYNAGGTSIDTSFVMKNNVEIYGGFDGTETSLEDRTCSNETILTTTGNYIFRNECYSSSSKLKKTSKIDGVTITGGEIYGIYNLWANPTISNCLITKNGEPYEYDNMGRGDAGIYNNYSAPTIINCKIIENNCNGIFYTRQDRFEDTTIISNCVIANNKHIGIHFGASIPSEIKNCMISKNSNAGICTSGFTTISECTIIENGRGIEEYGEDTVKIKNCTIANNRKDGIYSKYSADIINCTIINNGYGIKNFYYSENPSEIINCILWNNEYEIYNRCPIGVPGPQIPAPNVSYCIIQGGYEDGTNIITTDPLLGTLSDNGGVVQTIPVLAGSPAIGAGATGSDIPTTDARGFARSTTAPTIGAYEYIMPKIITQPSSDTVYSNNNKEFVIEAEGIGKNVIYQWQMLNDANEWVNVENATTNTLLIENCQPDLTGSKYRCVVSNEIDGVSVISEEVTLTVNKSISEATLSTNRITIVDGGYAHLEVSSDAIEPTYMWFYSSDLGKTWIEMEGEVTSSLSFQADSSMNRRQFKCEVTDGGGTSITTNNAVLIISSSAIVIDKNISDQTVIIGNTVELSVGVTSSSALAYQWQISTDGGTTWVDIADATSSAYSISPENYTLDGNLYRCKIDNGGGYIFSDTSKVTVFKNVEITQQPIDTLVWNSKPAQFSVSATGDGSITYQWQVSTNGAEWSNIEGASSAELKFESVSTDMNASQYRCVVTNEGGSVNSEIVTLTVYKTLEITTQPKDTYTFEGDDTTFSVEVDAQGEATYQWQTLSNGFWVDIDSETDSSLIIPNMDASKVGSQYKILIQNGGDVFESDVVTLNLATPISITKQPQIIDIVYIGKTATFTIEVEGYGAELQWYVAGNYGAEEGVAITGETSARLNVVVNEAILENVYYCEVKNSRETIISDFVYVNSAESLAPYQSWAYDVGLTGDNAKPESMPYNDGVTNLEKYVFGLDGTKATSYGYNSLFVQTNDGANAIFQFPLNKEISYLPKSRAGGEITVKVLSSEDLVNWTETSAAQTGESGNLNLYEVNKPIPEGGKLFFKVEVSQ